MSEQLLCFAKRISDTFFTPVIENTKKDRRGAYLLFNLKNLTYEKPTFGCKSNMYFRNHQIFFAFI
jgi:hypothetical protein